MRAVVQRVARGRVSVDDEETGSIDNGFVVLLGVEPDDTVTDVDYISEKISGLRVFDDAQGKMNLALSDVDGEVLVVSQFTLLGDCRKGRRPSYTGAAGPELAEKLYGEVVEALRRHGHRVATGRFRAQMSVELLNEGPVTLLLDSRKGF